MRVRLGQVLAVLVFRIISAGYAPKTFASYAAWYARVAAGTHGSLPRSTWLAPP